MVTVRDILFGRRLANREQNERKIGWIAGIPAIGLDGLGSSSYGPEAALTVLIPLGAFSLAYVGWVIAPIVALLVALYFSYRQTLVAYPSNGGAYTVAKENLGPLSALTAAAALMIDYVLNVAVGISAGVGALTSSIPALHPWTLTLCLGILALVALVNLRGTREAGLLFAVPTYLFLASFLAILGWAVLKLVTGHAEPVIAPPPLAPAMEGANLWLLLRAFAAGCTAMTGVEAVSNSVGTFREPVVREAHRTLTGICLSLGLLLAGIAVVAHGFHLGAMDQTKDGYQSVLSQLAGAIVGHGAIYYVAMASVLAVLCLSANTSFVGFPRLCRLVALDDYLPRGFAAVDRRLIFSVGVVFLTLVGGALLFAFRGITDRLIPLFAVGAFLTFTMSQIGMIRHWQRAGARAHWHRLTLNAVGAVTTIAALAIIVVAKFTEGAWIVVVALPLTVGFLLQIKRYYAGLERALATTAEFRTGDMGAPTVLVAYESRNRMTDRALGFAMTLSPDVIAVHLLRLGGPEQATDIAAVKAAFAHEVAAPLEARGITAPRLIALPAPYREIEGPLLELVAKIDADTPGRAVAILIPELVRDHWWERLLHSRRAAHLRTALLERGGERLMVITSPWRK